MVENLDLVLQEKVEKVEPPLERIELVVVLVVTAVQVIVPEAAVAVLVDMKVMVVMDVELVVVLHMMDLVGEEVVVDPPHMFPFPEEVVE